MEEEARNEETCDDIALRAELLAKYTRGARRHEIFDGIIDGKGLFDELEQVNNEEFVKIERSIIEEHLRVHGAQFTAARHAEIFMDEDTMGPKERKKSYKGTHFHYMVCEAHRNGGRDPADFSREFGKLVDEGYRAVRRRLGWPCSFAK